jgi:hypothetical protein
MQVDIRPVVTTFAPQHLHDLLPNIQCQLAPVSTNPSSDAPAQPLASMLDATTVRPDGLCNDVRR